MKKILWLVLFLLVLFVGLVYLSVSGTEKTMGTVIIKEIKDLEKTDFRDYDSLTVAASTLYTGSLLKETMQGSNYREAWATEITVPVVFLDTLFGGMKIIKEGGGSQTHSLRLQSASGALYSLRSINKDPMSHVPEVAKILGLENIVIDGISAQHPYGAIAAAALAEAAGILHTHPKPLFIPKQKILGDLNNRYGNRLYLLEFETEGDYNWTGLNNIVKIVDTEDLLELKMELGNKLKVDKAALIKARLFDLLIGDWDRHAKQWGWVLQKQMDSYMATPLPGDRDNAFFKLEGIIPSIISNKNIEPLVRPFEEKIDYLPGLVYPMDVYFLRGTPEELFISEAENLQNALTDEKIHEALKKWPAAFYELDGEEIALKIRQRREDLVDYAISFKEIIEEKPLLSKPLKGTEDLELNPELKRCFECENEDKN